MAQEIVPTERLDDWFYSRLGWGTLLAAIVGALIGTFHLSRLRFQHSSLAVNGQARAKLGIWLIVVFVVGGILLLLDAWTYPFITTSLDFSDAFREVWLNYRTIGVLFVSLAAFCFFVALTTRYVPWSRCPYAFWLGPRGK
jgi:hypothetical protein